jgi:hypothetical protein
MDDEKYEYKTFPIEAWMDGEGVQGQLERYKRMYDDLGFEFVGEIETDTPGAAPDVKQKLYQYRRLRQD